VESLRCSGGRPSHEETESLIPVSVDPLAPFRLDGQVVILTGASSGLGLRFAEVLHGAGATVVLAARRADRLAAVSASLPGSIVIPTDIANPEQCEALVDATLERCGRVDVLVNNAGLSLEHPPETEPIESWRQVMAINVDGLFQLTQHCAVKWMLQNGGVVCNVASMLGHVSSGRLQQASYAASKGAVVNLTRELAVLWARRNIRVNALCPGFFDSELTHELIDSEGGQRYLRQRTPMGRNGHVDELDGALLFLCSRASSYVTGQSLIVDGGWTAQ
jgi:NAD(P)-dependent dehydrogenase (short-subunit alcohol dehydrogenase family)